MLDDLVAKWEAEYGKNVYWSRENIWQASIAAATDERKWEGRRIIGWSEWTGGDNLRHAMLVLDDGNRYQIHERR
jgi:hypothetical protein